MVSQAQLYLTFKKKSSSIFYQAEKHIIYISELLMVVKNQQT
jgi:hypothetical protein